MINMKYPIIARRKDIRKRDIFKKKGDTTLKILKDPIMEVTKEMKIITIIDLKLKLIGNLINEILLN